MALTDDIELVNELLTLKDRIQNLGRRMVISAQMAAKADELLTTALETWFPPPPPSS